MAKKAKIFTEFKNFISRGSVIDLAVGIIIGSAFTAIVNSLVKDILMPFIGLILGGISFTDLKIVIAQATADTAEVAIMYGSFIQKVIDFLIIAIVVFLMVKSINTFRDRLEALKKHEEAEAQAAQPPVEPVIPADVALLSEIRDLLKEKK